MALLIRVLPWAYEADSLSGNLLFFCRILFCNSFFFIEWVIVGLLVLFSFQGIFCTSVEFCFAMGSIFLLKGVIVVLLLVVSLFLPLVDNLIEWAKDNMDEIVEGRQRRGLE